MGESTGDREEDKEVKMRWRGREERIRLIEKWRRLVGRKGAALGRN